MANQRVSGLVHIIGKQLMKGVGDGGRGPSSDEESDTVVLLVYMYFMVQWLNCVEDRWV
jgi:hypothetical protein